MIDKRRIRQVIRELRYDFHEFSVSDFVAYLETTRQRNIIVNGWPAKAGLHGFWLQAETADYVFFDEGTYAMHQVHHILHELGHIILEHQPRDLTEVLPPELLEALVGLGITAPRGHSRMWEIHETPEDREAEWFVRQLQHKILIAGRLAALTHPVTSIGEMTLLTRSLGYAD
jgi:hypothetical protein